MFCAARGGAPAPGRRSRPLRPVGRCSLDPLGPASCLSQALRACRLVSPSSGMVAMLSAENMRRPSSCQCSCCSSSTAPTRRVIEASVGKIPTTRVRRLISSFTRSSRLVLQILRQWSLGKWRKASTSSLASCMSAAALGKRSASEAARSSQRDSISSAVSWANMQFAEKVSITEASVHHCREGSQQLTYQFTAARDGLLQPVGSRARHEKNARAGNSASLSV